MIVIETSALAAIYRRESDADLFRERIAKTETLVLPASAYVELSSLRRYGKPRRWLDQMIERYDIAFGEIDAGVAGLAADAAERFGRGSGHPARLNFGDCLSYAVAKHLDAPLLFKGDDFALTDIESALPK
jgi:ribonuclease VapC